MSFRKIDTIYPSFKTKLSKNMSCLNGEITVLSE